MSTKKKARVVIMLFYALGSLIFALNILFKENISDFWEGFGEGFSIIVILSGFVYMCLCMIQKRNQFKNK